MKYFSILVLVLFSFSSVSHAGTSERLDALFAAQKEIQKNHGEALNYDFLYKIEQMAKTPELASEFKKLVNINPPEPIQNKYAQFLLGLLIDRHVLSVAASDEHLSVEQSAQVTDYLAERFFSYLRMSDIEALDYVSLLFKDDQGADAETLKREMILLTKTELKVEVNTDYASVYSTARAIDRAAGRQVNLILMAFFYGYMGLIAAIPAIGTGHMLVKVLGVELIASSILLPSIGIASVTEYFRVKKDAVKTVQNAKETLLFLRSIISCNGILQGSEV